MGNVIDLDLVREGDAHLKRAKRLNPNVTARSVPVAAIANGALTVTELAQIAGVHPQTIRRAIAARELQAASKGHRGHHRISRADAEAWWRRRGGGTLLETDKSDENVERIIAEVRAQLGHDAPRRALREQNEIAHDLGLLDELEAMANELTGDTPPLADDAVELAYMEREAAQL